MRKILVQFAHPAIARSKINKSLRAAIEGLDGVTVNDLYSNYPDFFIDVKREQKLCEMNDVIIFQHPLYWYSTPSIMKEWLDLVLEHGWAYGKQASGLKDKYFLQAFTAGGDDSTYQKNGFNEFPIADLTTPFRATAKLCGMRWLPPFAILGIHKGIPVEQINSYAEDYRRTVIALRDDTLSMEQAKKGPYLNSNIASIIRRP